MRSGSASVRSPPSDDRDLFDGERFATLDAVVAHLQSIGDEVLRERADRAVADLPEGVVYAGFSWGVGTAQQFAQARPGARGALLYESCIPITGEWALGPWPDGVPVQIHGMDKDPFFALEGDIDAARELWRRSGPSWPNCSSTRAISTYSPTARCRRTTPTRRHEWCSAHGSSSTGWGDSGERLDGCALGPSRPSAPRAEPSVPFNQ